MEKALHDRPVAPSRPNNAIRAVRIAGTIRASQQEEIEGQIFFHIRRPTKIQKHC
jgi:hypothetical protein